MVSIEVDHNEAFDSSSLKIPKAFAFPLRSLKKVAVLSSVATLACVLQMLFVAGGCYSDYFAGKTTVVRADIPLPGLEPGQLKYWNLDLERLVKAPSPLKRLKTLRESRDPGSFAMLQRL